MGVTATKPTYQRLTIERRPKETQIINKSDEKSLSKREQIKYQQDISIHLVNFSKSTANPNKLGEQPRAAVATITPSKNNVQDIRNYNLFAENKPIKNKNVTSRGSAPIEKRTTLSGNTPQDEAVQYFSNPNSDNWKELCSKDIENIFGGYC